MISIKKKNWTSRKVTFLFLHETIQVSFASCVLTESNTRTLVRLNTLKSGKLRSRFAKCIDIMFLGKCCTDVHTPKMQQITFRVLV